MIRGVGVDIVEIKRIERIAKERFLNRVFTEAEIQYIKSRANSAETTAGMFSAKEAAAKALGCGIGAVGFCDIEILHDKENAPKMFFYGAAAKIAENCTAHVSISHCREYATAVCILEEN